MKRELRDINAKELGKLEELVEISRFYGKDNRFVIAGGATLPTRTTRIYGSRRAVTLATITVDGFAVLDRASWHRWLRKRIASSRTNGRSR